ncbi:hypothetical protein [Vibrio chagasii]|uniref:hypothetical protein n=1 Tax=Vibrio chagasii TaxID=170679 RepID=UPI001EFC8BF6|nr:hypothetical protein [Vibrio chagasii]MCG9565018.1 hypothetical protein [Vibrio chagasii]
MSFILFFSMSSFANVVNEGSETWYVDNIIKINTRISDVESKYATKNELLEAKLINNDVKNHLGTVEDIYREFIDYQDKYISQVESRLDFHIQRQDKQIDIIQGHTDSYFSGLTILLVFVTFFAGFFSYLHSKKAAVDAAKAESESWCEEKIPEAISKLEDEFRDEMGEQLKIVKKLVDEVKKNRQESSELVDDIKRDKEMVMEQKANTMRRKVAPEGESKPRSILDTIEQVLSASPNNKK